MQLKLPKCQLWPQDKTFVIHIFTKKVKKLQLGLDTAHIDGLCPKFEKNSANAKIVPSKWGDFKLLTFLMSIDALGF